MSTRKEPKSKPVTIADIAASVGVDKSAVYQALKGTGRISVDRRTQILAAAEEMGYEPDPIAQRLATGRAAGTIVIVSLVLDRGIYTEQIRLIQELLSLHGYTVPLHAYWFHDIAGAKDQEILIRTLRREKPIGMVVFTGGLRQGAIDELRRYQDEGGMLVTYDQPSELPCDQVTFSEFENTQLAMTHLLDIGHRDIGLVLQAIVERDHARCLAWERTLTSRGQTPNEEWLFADGVYERAGHLAAKWFLELKRRPTALAVVNDITVATLVGELTRAGLRLPEDLSVVGHDGLPVSEYGLLPLTTVTRPADKMASMVVSFLLDRVAHGYDGPPRQAVVSGALVVRESTLPSRSQPSKGPPETSLGLSTQH